MTAMQFLRNSRCLFSRRVGSFVVATHLDGLNGVALRCFHVNRKWVHEAGTSASSSLLAKSVKVTSQICNSASFSALAEPLEDVKMFCYQCEQTTKGTGCTSIGVCGKTPEVSALQDLLVFGLKGLAGWAHHARNVANYEDPEINLFITGSLFSTLTNVNFDDLRFQIYIERCATYTEKLRTKMKELGHPALESPPVPWFDTIPHPFEWKPATEDYRNVGQLIDYGHQVGIIHRQSVMHNDTLLGLHELLTYGLKGTAAYCHHASMLGKSDGQVHAELQAQLAFLATPAANDVSAVLSKCMEVGQTNLKVMQMLDEAHNAELGTPKPTEVSTSPKPGKAILVTGHDLADLRALLEQTEGTGVNVYTHGEMLPGHSYPELKKFKHLAGNYGGAWYKQKKEFAAFPGSILVTTNCVLHPLSSYADNIFTTGETGVGGVRHVEHRDFSSVIARAKQLPGFPDDVSQDGKVLTVGFGRQAVLNAADQVLKAVHDGNLSHIFLIGGCDGSEPQRKYYANLSHTMRPDHLVLTLGCGKFRLLDQAWGTLPNTTLPRLLDMGQCNDAYGAIVVASELAKALGTDINSLPLSLDLSWFEQKAVAVLLTLLSLGVRNIRVGPRMPAFLTPEATQVLVDSFGLKPADVSHPEEDVRRMVEHT